MLWQKFLKNFRWFFGRNNVTQKQYCPKDILKLTDLYNREMRLFQIIAQCSEFVWEYGLNSYLLNSWNEFLFLKVTASPRPHPRNNKNDKLSAWRNFKNIFSRPLFTIIFRLEMLKFHQYSFLTGDTMVGFVIIYVLKLFFQSLLDNFDEKRPIW